MLSSFVHHPHTFVVLGHPFQACIGGVGRKQVFSKSSTEFAQWYPLGRAVKAKELDPFHELLIKFSMLRPCILDTDMRTCNCVADAAAPIAVKHSYSNNLCSFGDPNTAPHCRCCDVRA